MTVTAMHDVTTPNVRQAVLVRRNARPHRAPSAPSALSGHHALTGRHALSERLALTGRPASTPQAPAKALSADHVPSVGPGPRAARVPNAPLAHREPVARPTLSRGHRP